MDAGTSRAVRRSLDRLDAVEQEQIAAPIQVVRTGRRPTVVLRAAALARGRSAEYAVRLASEEGETLGAEGRLAPRGTRRVALRLPVVRSEGYHTVHLDIATTAGPRKAELLLLAVPPRGCTRVTDLLGRRKGFGLLANLYAVRSARNWGVGDLTDLGELLAWSRDAGAAFVGINPLHATRNRGSDISPYAPVSRLIRNPVYLDVTAIPEWADAADARSHAGSPSVGEALQRVRAATRVDYAAVMRLKEPVLRILHRCFRKRHADGKTDRGRAYRAFCDRWDPHLTAAATFLALNAHFRRRGLSDWRSWPSPFRDPHSPAVKAFARSNEEAVDFHRYLQFELDRQLRSAVRRGTLPVGVLGDLAIGSAAGGADTWIFPQAFVSGAHLGAPPDAFIPTGQDWGMPPLDPLALVGQRLRVWIALVRSALSHCGALRIDHVMGLFRQYWIPEGSPPAAGAYVRYPSRALLAVLAIESHRHRAVIVGEDLGTVPRNLPAVLARWGILSTRVLYFERDADGGFRSARRYSKRALLAAHTHDQVPLAGYWKGRDFDLQRRLGFAPAEESLERRRRALRRRLVRERCASPGETLDAPAALCRAVHCFLSRTPAPLLGVSLDDLAGEDQPVNVPGVPPDRYPSWTRRLAVSLEQLRTRPEVHQSLGALASRKWQP